MLQVSPLSPERVCAICESGIRTEALLTTILTRLDIRGFAVHNILLEGSPLPKSSLIPLIKPIEATKIHPRTGMSLGSPDVTIPYGALIEHAGSDPDRDREKFTYLSELYACKREVFLARDWRRQKSAPAYSRRSPGARSRCGESTGNRRRRASSGVGTGRLQRVFGAPHGSCGRMAVGPEWQRRDLRPRPRASMGR